MKKTLTTMLTAVVFALSLVLVSCSGNSGDSTLERTTTAGLDIGAASGRRNQDTVATDADTLRTTTTGTTATGGATTH